MPPDNRRLVASTCPIPPRSPGRWRPAIRGAESKADHSLYASLHYVGPSVLGPAPLLDIRQGGYAVVDLGGTRRLGQLRLRLGVENLLNTRANRFSLGNPLLLYRRDGAAPLPPRTIAVGLEVAM